MKSRYIPGSRTRNSRNKNGENPENFPALDNNSGMPGHNGHNGNNGRRTAHVSIRVGLHSGSCVAGVIGKKKFAFDVWGDAVNTAARMETSSEENKVHCSKDTY